MSDSWKMRWTKDDICTICRQHRSLHKVEFDKLVTDWLRWHCPDTSLPDPDQDDDPWEPSVHEPEPSIAALFDSYA